MHPKLRNIEHIIKNLPINHHTPNSLDFKGGVITYHNRVFSILVKVLKLFFFKA